MALAMRSGPTSAGLRYRILRPVRAPAWRMNGSTAKYFRQQLRREYSISGTTEQIAIWLMRDGSCPFSRTTPRRKTPSSSDAADGRDVLRNCSCNRPSSKMPPNTWLLPTSSARITAARSRVAFRRIWKAAALDVVVVRVQGFGQHGVAVEIAPDESRRMFAAYSPQVLQHQDLSVRAWTRADSDRRYRQLRGDAASELRGYAFEHDREAAETFELVSFTENPVRVFRSASLHTEPAELVHRLWGHSDVTHERNTGLDNLADDAFVS